VVLDANAAIAALRKHVVASSAFSGAIIRAVDARTKQTSCAADENDVARAHEKENKRRAPGAGKSWRQESRGCGGKWIIRWRSNGALLNGECLFYLAWPCAQCHSAAFDLYMSLGEASAAPWHVCAGFPGPWARAPEAAHQRTEASDSEPLGRVWNCTPVTIPTAATLSGSHAGGGASALKDSSLGLAETALACRRTSIVPDSGSTFL
jgi:hypothetical protein